MQSPQIQTAKFINFSDFKIILGNDNFHKLLDELNDYLVWGANNRTLISLSRMTRIILHSEFEFDVLTKQNFEKHVMSLEDFENLYVDLEN